MRRLQFLPKGIEHIKIATAFDNDGKYDEAIAEYVKGIGYFQTALKCASLQLCCLAESHDHKLLFCAQRSLVKSSQLSSPHIGRR